MMGSSFTQSASMLLDLFDVLKENSFRTLVMKAGLKHKHISLCVALYFAEFSISYFIIG